MMSELKQLSQRERAEDGFLRYLHGKIKIKKKKNTLPAYIPALFTFSKNGRNYGWGRSWFKRDLGYSFQDAIYKFNALIGVFCGYLALLSSNANPFAVIEFLQMTSRGRLQTSPAEKSFPEKNGQ